jgi:hypothetical protein
MDDLIATASVLWGESKQASNPSVSGQSLQEFSLIRAYSFRKLIFDRYASSGP